MSSPKRSKDWGRETENAALAKLRTVFFRLFRTGSMNYRKAAPDLYADCVLGCDKHTDLNLVVTRDKGKRLLVTASMDDFIRIAGLPDVLPYCRVRVQVKARQQTWVGRIYQELVNAP